MALLLLSNLHMCPHVIQATTLVQKLTFELGDGSVGVTQLPVDYSVSSESKCTERPFEPKAQANVRIKFVQHSTGDINFVLGCKQICVSMQNPTLFKQICTCKSCKHMQTHHDQTVISESKTRSQNDSQSFNGMIGDQTQLYAVYTFVSRRPFHVHQATPAHSGVIQHKSSSCSANQS